MFKPLPRHQSRIIVPPIKCQGIKTKLVSFILANIKWQGKGRWIEPFLGSGVVAFNVAPPRALLNDINPHIVGLYQGICNGTITPIKAREFLSEEGDKLEKYGEEHFYSIRERFNKTGDPLDFLFLNRACFNGLMRFNSKGGFNVPFCRKPERFALAYISKISNQIASTCRVMHDKDWQFTCTDWRICLQNLNPDDFVYMDPPYIGRHTDYYTQWSDQDATDLANAARHLPCGFALSMWKENQYRANDHLQEYWDWAIERTFTHFYHLGATEELRNSMEEALMIKPGYEGQGYQSELLHESEQLALAIQEKPILYKNSKQLK